MWKPGRRGLQQQSESTIPEDGPPWVFLALPSVGDTAGDFAANGDASGSWAGAKGDAVPGQRGMGGGNLANKTQLQRLVKFVRCSA